MPSIQAPEPKIEHLTHVLAVCVLRRYFVDNASGRVIRDEDGYTVEEAKAEGLDPILACRLAVDQIKFTSTIFAPLSKGLDVGEFLTRVWKKEHMFRGPPKQLMVDDWMLEVMPTLKEDLAALGCESNSEDGRRKVSGTKGALQRMRLHVGNATEGFSVEDANRSAADHERFWMAYRCSEPAGYWYSKQVEERPWPKGKGIREEVVREDPVIWGGVPVKVRPERDQEADRALAMALAPMTQVYQSRSLGLSGEEASVACLRKGLAAVAQVLKEPLAGWQKWFEWNQKAYLFGAAEAMPAMARLRVAEPVHWIERMRGEQEKLPERWPMLNDYPWEFLAFGLDLEVWSTYKRYEWDLGLRVAVTMERNGAHCARRALRSPQADSIRKAISKGRFKLDCDEGGPAAKTKKAWLDFNQAVADEGAMPNRLALHRTFENGVAAHEVIEAMWNALELIEALVDCCIDEEERAKDVVEGNEAAD